MAGRLAVLFHRLGPYHVARLRAAAAVGRGVVVAVELSGHTHEYAWAPVAADGFERVTAYAEGDSNDLAPAALAARVEAALEATRPDVLAVAGWGDKGMIAATRWGVRRGVPVVVMSDSQYHDEPRVWWKEAVKRQVVGCYRAAFVAGRTHADYLVRLGMPRGRIRDGYDVVDNDYFAAGAAAARRDAARVRVALGLPERFFLACNRFIGKKNLPALIDAFARYRRAVGAGAWGLVLVGDGPLRPQFEGQIRALGLDGAVVLPGFKQYDELPAYYGLASAYVHASTVDQWGLVVNEAMAAGLPVLVSRVCGCAPELVRPGVNGHTFGPTDVAGLAGLMKAMAGDAARAEQMGRESQRVVADWGLPRFAERLWQAAEIAWSSPPRGGVSRRWLLSRLIEAERPVTV